MSQMCEEAKRFGITAERGEEVHCTGHSHAENEETTIEVLENAIAEMRMGCDGKKGSDLSGKAPEESRKKLQCEHFPSVKDVTDRFTLNKLQSQAFRIVAEAFLLRIANGYDCFRRRTKHIKGKFSMHLGGEGGTGKSRVIEAIQYFTLMWGRPDAVRTCAPTGIAASLVRGRKIHSFLGLRAGGKFNRRKRPSQSLIEEHAETMLVIIDEISMMNRRTLASLDFFLRGVKEVDEPFGGVMLLFCGDFFQIPPVASDPIYIHPSKSSRTVQFLDQVGYEIWQHLDFVVILEENMRHLGDSVFDACLKRIRRGQATESDLRLLNTRVLQKNVKNELKHYKDHVPMAVRSNALRMALNWKAVGAHSKACGLKPILSVARIHTEKGIMCDEEDIRMLFRMHDMQTGNLPILLPMLPGMPLRLTQNSAVELGIANGTEGTLVGLDFPPQATFSEAEFFGVQCIAASTIPDVASIRSKVFSKSLPRRFHCLPTPFSNDTVPILPAQHDNVTVQLRGSARRTNNSFRGGNKFRIEQFPFVLAYASMTYKVQGITANGIIAYPFVRGCPGLPSKASLYVVLSRVRAIRSLFLTNPLTKEDIEFFRPSSSLLKEEQRLKDLHVQTPKNLSLSNESLDFLRAPS